MIEYKIANQILPLDTFQRESEENIKLKQELQKTREQLFYASSRLKYAVNSLEFANSLMDEDEDDTQEMNEWIVETRVFLEQYFKDKQGER